MRVTLIGYGTRGDVQPALCLAWGLMVRGHRVRLLAPRTMERWIARSGVSFAALPVDAQSICLAREWRRMLANGRVADFFERLPQFASTRGRDMRRVLCEATEDAEAIITHPLLEERAAAIGGARQIPVMPLHPFPHVSGTRFWRLRRRQRALRILAYSPSIFPSPSDASDGAIVTGTIAPPVPLRVLLGESGIPASLESWLRAGDPPIFLGFGGMPISDVDRLVEVTRETLAKLGKRAVVGAGWRQVPKGGDRTLFAMREVDHSALLPRCVAAVHHGGSGTTYASLSAGCPTLVCSVFEERPLLGQRVRELGVGDTLSLSKLTAERFAARLEQLLTPAVRERAERLSKRLSREDGLMRAVRVVEQTLSNAAEQ
jgi:UDP:flavonoid glycosyltransferase YjiC (YdhE family)